MTRGHRSLAVLVTAAVGLGACTGDGDAPDAEQATQRGSAASEGVGSGDGDATDDPSPSPSPADAADEVQLAEVPTATTGWPSSVGLPVAGAIRTSTPLARLQGVAPDERLAICRQVATELDGIATPELLTLLSITADAETATLLVSDLRAKTDLLAVCDQDGEEVEALVAEVAATHEVAVAWLAAIRGRS